MLVSAVQQSESGIYTRTAPSLSSLPLRQVITENPAAFPVPYSSFLLGTYFTHASVYMSVLLSLEVILLNVFI